MGEGRDTNTNAVAALAALSGCCLIVVAEVIHPSQSPSSSFEKIHVNNCYFSKTTTENNNTAFVNRWFYIHLIL
jgi:hypothetical protein